MVKAKRNEFPMKPKLPIEIPEKLPISITPCPIVEAIFEVRFTSLQPWENMPGLLYSQIREKYPSQKRLPLADFPEEFRRQDPSLLHLPLLQFHGKHFLVQLGPRCLSLVTAPNLYPGWNAIQEELDWLTPRLQAAGVVSETERIGVRYIDFFEENVFEILRLQLRLGDGATLLPQTDVTTILKHEAMTIRLHASNAAILGDGQEMRQGSVLDMDCWFGALDADCFENGTLRFSEAHHTIKGLFFGLMKPEVLANFRPHYP